MYSSCENNVKFIELRAVLNYKTPLAILDFGDELRILLEVSFP